MNSFVPFQHPGQMRHWPRDRFWQQPLNSRIVVVNRPPYREIYVNYMLAYRFPVDGVAEERLALVMLMASGAISEQDLAHAYGYHYNTLCNWRRRYRQYGFEGLKPGNPAGLDPVPTACEEQAANLAQTRLELPAAMAPSQECETETAPESVPPAAGEQRWTRYAGVLLCLPFLHQLLAPVLAYVRARPGEFHSPRKQWRLEQLLVGLVFYFLLGALNVEQTKALHHQEVGVIFRRSRGPSCRTLRRDLANLTAGDLPAVIGRELALQLIRLGWIEVGELSLDGHFVPYYGKANLPRGYFPQRRHSRAGAPNVPACTGPDVSGRSHRPLARDGP